MTQQDFSNALNDCIDRLNAGQRLEDCLRDYPHYADSLRSLLEAGLLVRQAQPDPLTVAQARERVRARVAQAAARPALRVRFLSSYALAASLILVFTVVLGGVVVALRPGLGAATATPTPLPPTATATLAPTATATSTPTPTPPTSTPTPTSSPTEAPSATPTVDQSPATATVVCGEGGPPGWVEYRVQPGDTLFSLARRAGITLDVLMEANCLTNPNLIVVGQTLYLPGEEAAPPGPSLTPTLAAGDAPPAAPPVIPTQASTPQATLEDGDDHDADEGEDGGDDHDADEGEDGGDDHDGEDDGDDSRDDQDDDSGSR